MFKVLTRSEALGLFFQALPIGTETELMNSADALGRVLCDEPVAPSSLPSFARSTMDGYAVRAAHTFGGSESLPAFLSVAGEVPMGRDSGLTIRSGECALIHTGGMLPTGADAVVMIEHTQKVDADSIEVLRPVATGENVIAPGEDINEGDLLFARGHVLRPQDIGGLMSLGITQVEVAAIPRVAIISTGDEVVSPEKSPLPGQIRDVNSYTIAGVVTQAGGIPLLLGVVGDRYEVLLAAARAAMERADVLVISAGSSVSSRDLTAAVINELGSPGVIVHGVAVKPGKPTILGVCGGKPVLGLPGNPVSAMVVASLFLAPLLAHLQGTEISPPRVVEARLAHNVSSAPGREDYLPVKLGEREGQLWAQPVFGKSNLIHTLVKADGRLSVPLDCGGLYEGTLVKVELF
jgi:molybdopterin molybdotransferase